MPRDFLGRTKLTVTINHHPGGLVCANPACDRTCLPCVCTDVQFVLHRPFGQSPAEDVSSRAQHSYPAAGCAHCRGCGGEQEPCGPLPPAVGIPPFPTVVSVTVVSKTV